MSDTQPQVEQQIDEEHKGKLGALLKVYRNQSGHDIYEVAEALCLSPEIVRSLEEEDFDSLPEPPYVRGYLRSYAKFADIDPKEIISLYEKQRGANPKDLEHHFKPLRNSHLKKPLISPALIRLGLVVLLLAAIASIGLIPTVNQWMDETWAGFSQQTAQRSWLDSSDDTPLLSTEMPAPLPDDVIIKKTVDQDKKRALTEKIHSSTETSNSSDNKAIETIKNPLKKESNANDESDTDKKADDKKTLEGKEGTNLKFVFKSEVWMRIKDKNRKTVFESLSPSGDEKEIKLQKPMTFRIGNAAGVEIYVEGKRLNIKPFIKGSVANFTIE
ncbi:MAG: helix-turn-helix domain-containing protein [Cocleimonas sp.]|nr:helix-turn-helix domain-containing protein [Cocleimonas sp.]